jgi:glycosyltransferase involved in cell wall biosynthesis
VVELTEMLANVMPLLPTAKEFLEKEAGFQRSNLALAELSMSKDGERWIITFFYNLPSYETYCEVEVSKDGEMLAFRRLESDDEALWDNPAAQPLRSPSTQSNYQDTAPGTGARLAMSQHKLPLVSVIITVHNGEKTICQTVESALCQSYPESEIIVVDHGSSDSSLELLSKYETNIQLLRKGQGPLAVARNTGISAAKGKYIAFLDHDDTWIPEKIQFQVEALSSHPSIGVTFGNLYIMSKDGEKLDSTFLDVISPNSHYSPSWGDLLVKGFTLPVSCSMVRKELVEGIGGFDSNFVGQGYEDRDFFLRLREITDFLYLDRCLGYYRIDESHGLRHQRNLDLYAEKYWNHPKLLTPASNGIRDEFVATCAKEMLWRAKLQLKLEQDLTSKEMLESLNEWHDSLKGIFGDAYRRVTGFDSIDLGRYDLNDATSILLYLYLYREDLQNAFPEVRSGDMNRLVDWGTRVARGHFDSDRSIILPHNKKLEQLRK